MNYKIGLSAALCVVLNACSTIHFDRNTDKQAESVTYQQWHHNFFFALYEGSKPVNLVEICQQQDWQSVKTEVSFLNGLATTVVNYVAPIWYPKTVDVSCTSSEISNVN
ncbi:Bor family protein [Rheinheimera aquimaris]|uniref:Bor family protein n=1 Tax=Rheinheimera aquimaris TaxID=412437 RepID=UPI001E3DF026|nr:Bor family protein [Rheinheimera aquimaris]MCD1597931.1 Bor family protein [Rheinheimera aquimaris]